MRRMQEESWKVIPENPRYEVSSHGRVRRKYETHPGYSYLKGSAHGSGMKYRKVMLSFKDGSVIHRKVQHLVARMFMDPKPARQQSTGQS